MQMQVSAILYPMDSLVRRVPQAQRQQQALALLRIVVGVFVGYQGWLNLTDPNFSLNLASFFRSWAAQNPLFFYQDFLNYLAAPNAWLLGPLITYSQLFIGAGLVTGTLTRFNSLLLLFFTANAFLATQHTGMPVFGLSLFIMIMAWTLFWGDAGRHYGLDSLFLGSSRPARAAKKPTPLHRKTTVRKSKKPTKMALPPLTIAKRENKSDTKSKKQKTAKVTADSQKRLKDLASSLDKKVQSLTEDEDDTLTEEIPKGKTKHVRADEDFWS
ncbi:MAG: DoxX family membrane protein [Vampirovibrio sp.]|nr:DoxX family membrane protein [Vampirovibrio sp.]